MHNGTQLTFGFCQCSNPKFDTADLHNLRNILAYQWRGNYQNHPQSIQKYTTATKKINKISFFQINVGK